MALPDVTDFASWTKTLNDLIEQGDTEKLRELFGELVKAYPTSSLLWYSWMQYEWRQHNYEELERLFAESLKPYGDVRMWKLYIQYVKLCNPDVDGEENEAALTKRQSIIKAYELALTHVGLDLQSSFFYRDYVAFIQTWKCQSLYEQQVQMDHIRKVYNRALITPIDGIEGLWHDYDSYENNLNKLTAKKIVADKSAGYMAARSAAKELKEILSTLDRDEYALRPSDPTAAVQKLSLWQRWIDWEKGNPLNIPDKATLLLQRVQYAYRCSLCVLRYHAELWFFYTRFLLAHGKREEADVQFKMAISVLPLNLMINFAYCDMLEAEGESGKPSEAKDVYEKLIEKLQKHIDSQETDNASPNVSHEIQSLTLAYIQYINYSRRTEGIMTARAVFTRARKVPCLNHQIYIAAAKMEYYCKKDATVAGKIFELGMSKFSQDGEYVLEYLQHLIAINDEQNIRALFERAVLSVSPENAIDIWKAYLDYVFRYGDSGSIKLLTKRFQEAFPEEVVSKEISTFCRQYSYDTLDIASERLWMLLQGGAGIPSSTAKEIPKPFYISDLIYDMIEKLPTPDKFVGPVINPEAMVRLLQVARLVPDANPIPVGIPNPVVSSTKQKKPTSSRTTRSKRYRLDDGDARNEIVAMPVRADDIFAQRRG